MSANNTTSLAPSLRRDAHGSGGDRGRIPVAAVSRRGVDRAEYEEAPATAARTRAMLTGSPSTTYSQETWSPASTRSR